MGFTDSLNSCFENYTSFSGRAARAEYWWFAVFIAAVYFIATTADSVVFGSDSRLQLFGLVAAVALFMPALSVSIRRLHDLDRSGWWLLVALVPIFGAVVLLLWYFSRGTYGSNRYGPDPLRETMSATALYGAP